MRAIWGEHKVPELIIFDPLSGGTSRMFAAEVASHGELCNANLALCGPSGERCLHLAITMGCTSHCQPCSPREPLASLQESSCSLVFFALRQAEVGPDAVPHHMGRTLFKTENGLWP